MAKLPHIKHFLCCISLRTGILAMAYIGVACNLMSLLGLLILMNTSDEEFQLDDNRSDSVILEEIGKRQAAQQIPTIIVNLGLTSLLIFGVIKRRPGFFIPWIAVAGFGMIIYTIVMVALPFLLAFLFPDMPVVCTVAFGVGLLIYLFCGHFFLVVHSYYRQLKSELQQEAAQNEVLVENKEEEKLNLPPSYSDVINEKVAV